MQQTLSATHCFLATVVTPNLPEAAALLNVAEATTRSEMEEQASLLLQYGPRAVMLKAGISGDESPDLWLTQDEAKWLEAPRVNTLNTHGTGCALSSALAAFLPGASLSDVGEVAKRYVANAIQESEKLHVGSRHGPYTISRPLGRQGVREMRKLKEQVVLVSGAGRGLGASIARALHGKAHGL